MVGYDNVVTPLWFGMLVLESCFARSQAQECLTPSIPWRHDESTPSPPRLTAWVDSGGGFPPWDRDRPSLAVGYGLALEQGRAVQVSGDS